MVFGESLYFKECEQIEIAPFYINLVLRLDPNNIKYKYQYLDIEQEHIVIHLNKYIDGIIHDIMLIVFVNTETL